MLRRYSVYVQWKECTRDVHSKGWCPLGFSNKDLFLFNVQVIVADNFFSGSKDNLKKWIGHPDFELIRHGLSSVLLFALLLFYRLLYSMII